MSLIELSRLDPEDLQEGPKACTNLQLSSVHVLARHSVDASDCDQIPCFDGLTLGKRCLAADGDGCLAWCRRIVVHLLLDFEYDLAYVPRLAVVDFNDLMVTDAAALRNCQKLLCENLLRVSATVEAAV